MREFDRSERLNDEIRNRVSQLLLRDANDPRLTKVSVTAAKVSDCLSFAKIYWVLLSTDEPSERDKKRVQRALNSAAGFFRSKMAEDMPQRTVPELRFVFDESIERGRRMENLIAGLPENRSDDEGDS